MIAGLTAFANKEDHSKPKIDIIGLGGGVLPMSLHLYFNVDLSVVELDPVIAQVAKEWFSIDASIPVHIGDGVQYIKDQSNKVMIFKRNDLPDDLDTGNEG